MLVIDMGCAPTPPTAPLGHLGGGQSHNAARLSVLPGAEKEAGSVAGLFSSKALTGAQATKAAVIQHAGDSRVLHFAT